jgi:hypothetical protein
VRRLPSILLVAGAVVVAVVLFLVLRPDDNDGPSAGTTTTTAPRTTSTATTTAPTTTAEPPQPQRTRVGIAIRDGRVLGGIRRINVERHALVELVVIADVSDHVHLHGYDIMRDVAPGAPARLPFRASTPGRFEVELEDRKLQIAEVTVEP